MKKRFLVPLAALGIGLVLAAAPREAAAGECLDCHARDSISAGERSVHRPFDRGKCADCHLDHGADRRLVLTREGNALCRECHDPSKRSFVERHGGIRGDGASCLACHDPHRSELASLLRPGRHRPLAFGNCDSCHRYDGRLYEKEVAELCFRCHERGDFSRPYGHAPATEGNCLACHDPHGSKLPSLLLRRYSESRWITRGEKDYELCLDCHFAQAFNEAGGVKTSAFHSEDINIHRIHVEESEERLKVSRDRGLTCRNCHEAHSSTWPRLIRSDLDCGGVPCLKMEFRTVPGGGECSVSCHGTRSYSRGEPVPFPPAPPPPESVAAEPLVPEPPPEDKDMNRMCLSCHEEEIQGFSRTYVHRPVRKGDCSACHLPHGAANELVLVESAETLCARCHDLDSRDIRRAHRSYPLAGAVCTECHDPHASGRKALLYSQEHKPFRERNCEACHEDPEAGWRVPEGVNAVCSKCHGDIASDPFPHTALPRQSCKGCHRPHASEEEHLLRAAGPDLCYLCHSRRSFTGATVHEPVRDGKCDLCHPPHGSAVEGLFTGTYPLEKYLNFRPGAYNLCWKCHEAENLIEPETGGTGFRDSLVSLHSLHLRDHLTVTSLGERSSPGVTCRSCHDPHATAGPHLVREKLDCGGVPCLELEFRKTVEGGTCRRGCHTEQSYRP